MKYRVVCNYTQPSEKNWNQDETHEHLVRRVFDSLDQAQKYADSVAPSRNPKILLELGSDHTDIPVKDRVARLKKELSRILLPWEPDGCMPKNFRRLTGDGKTVCEVNRWCGGYQDTHKPITIGYSVTGFRTGVLLVSDYNSVDEAIEAAKHACMELLIKNKKHHHFDIMEES